MALEIFLKRMLVENPLPDEFQRDEFRYMRELSTLARTNKSLRRLAQPVLTDRVITLYSRGKDEVVQLYIGWLRVDDKIRLAVRTSSSGTSEEYYACKVVGIGARVIYITTDGVTTRTVRKSRISHLMIAGLKA